MAAFILALHDLVRAYAIGLGMHSPSHTYSCWRRTGCRQKRLLPTVPMIRTAKWLCLCQNAQRRDPSGYKDAVGDRPRQEGRLRSGFYGRMELCGWIGCSSGTWRGRSEIDQETRQTRQHESGH
ncbi:hypothetical protein J3F83DRAFT_628491 [Trichoderma novae-zelandiae]